MSKKNHLFIGSPTAGDKSAVLYSLLLSAKACGVPPQQYLRDVMERLPQIKTWDEEALLELTPSCWAEVWHTRQATQEESKGVA